MRITIIRGADTFSPDAPGVIRMMNYARFFARSGMQVSVWHTSTGDLGNDRRLEDEERKRGVALHLVHVNNRWWSILNRIDILLSKLLFLPKISVLRNLQFVFLARKKIITERPDCVIATLPEVGALSLVAKIARKVRARFVIDFRDTPDEFDPEHKRLTTRRIMKWIQKDVCAVDLVVTVSMPLVESLRNFYGLRNIHLVMNGYEGTLDCSSVERTRNEKFRIFYSGSLAYGRMDALHLLFEALDVLEGRGQIDINEIEFVVAGWPRKETFDQFKRYSSFKRFRSVGVLPRDQVLGWQLNANVLLCVASPMVRGVLTSKLFEYIKTRRPILVLPSDFGVIDEFIARTRTGKSCNTALSAADYLQELIFDWHQGVISLNNPNFSILRQYSREWQNSKFLNLISEL